MQFFKDTKIDFVGARKTGFILSALLLLASIISLIIHGGPRYNVDFTGGRLMHIKFEKKVNIGDVRSALSSAGYRNSEITHFGETSDIIIRTGQDKKSDAQSQSIEDVLQKAFPGNPFDILQNDTVGPKIGKELKIHAINAIVWSLFLILIYIMWRFEFRFALGAILALAHDVIITVGVFSVLNFEISSQIIAALLTLVGYSLNDTIVVYDRIRENLKIKQKDVANFIAVVNRSINETLSRTIITALTTLFAVFVLFFFGGEVLRTFAFALIFGIIIGTYSSIFIATPFIVEWQIRKAAKIGL